MEPLTRLEHEQFALAYVAQRDRVGAYKLVYPNCKSEAAAVSAARRLLATPKIAARVAYLQSQVAAVVVEQTGVDQARIVAEVAKIAFGDIRKVVRWHPEVTEHTDEEDGGDVVTVTRTIQNRVTLVSSEEIDDDTAAAIASVSLSSTGTLTVKMNDKLGALKELREWIRPDEPAGVTNINKAVFIDAPPGETYEQWAARTAARRAPAGPARIDGPSASRERGDSRAVDAPGGAPGRRNPSDVVR